MKKMIKNRIKRYIISALITAVVTRLVRYFLNNNNEDEVKEPQSY